MNETLHITDASNGHEASNFQLVDFLVAMAKRKRIIVGVPLLAAIVATGIGFALPPVFKANAKLLPPQQSQSGSAALLSQLSAVGAVAGVGAMKNPNDLYIGMLKSRTIADSLIAKFYLFKVYDKPTMEKTRLKLQENTSISAGKDGLISIDVEDSDRQRVASLANAYVAELVKLTRVLAVTEASQRRVFFEHQLEVAKDNLANAEVALKSALDTHGVISVDADSAAIVATVSGIRAQIAAKEIELSSMSAFVTTNNSEYKRTHEELISLRGQLSKLQNGQPALTSDDEKVKHHAGLENIKILRNVKYYQMLYELLAKQYEAARLDEAKDSSLVQVLDGAIEPEREVKPRRALIVIVTTLLSLFGVIGWALLAERNERTPQPPEAVAKWARLKSHLRKG